MSRIFVNLVALCAGLWLSCVAQMGSAQIWSLNVVDFGYDPIGAGGEISYRVPINNATPSATPATTMTFAIPANSVYKGLSGPLTGCTPSTLPLTGPATLTCDLPSIPPMSGIEAQLRLETVDLGSLTLAATIAAGSPDEVRAEQTTAVVASADLALTITGPNHIDAGKIYPLVLTVTNQGKHASGGATATATLPPGLAPPTSLPPGCTMSSQTVTCVVQEPLAMGESASFTIETQVTTDQDVNIAVAGQVTSTPNSPVDPNLTNNTALHDFNVTPNTDVSIGKTNDASAVALVGDTITFTLTPKYAGLVPLEAQIIDSVPGNYTITGVSPAPGSDWSCEIDAQSVICDYETATADAASYTGPITITALVTTPTQALGDPPEKVYNTATIYSPTDVLSNNNLAEDDGASVVAPYTDLEAFKSRPTLGLAVVGQSYDWQIWSGNYGMVPFYGTLVFDDYIPAGLVVEAINTPLGWSCTPSTLPLTGPVKVTCSSENYTNSSPLGIGQTSPPITLTTKVVAAGEIKNELFVSSPNYNAPDPFQGNNHITPGITAGTGQNIANLSLTKNITSTGPYKAGDTIDFELEIINSGPGSSADIVISDALKKLYYADGTTTGVTLTPIAPAATTTNMICDPPARAGDFTTNVSCQIERLNACSAGVDCPKLRITASVGADGPQTNTAEAYSTTTPDPDLNDNEARVNYTVAPRTDLVLTKTATPTSGNDVLVAQRLTYTLTVSVPKNGLSAASNVTLTETLPKGLYYEFSNTGDATCSSDSWPSPNTTPTVENETITCTWPTIPNGGSKTLTYVFLPDDHQVPRGLSNNASVTTTTEELTLTNNSGATTHTVIPGSYDLLVNKTSTPENIAVGDEVTYTVTIDNTGPEAAYLIEVTDLFPSQHLTYVSHDVGSSGFVCSVSNVPPPGEAGGTLTCTRPVIDVNTPLSFDVTMRALSRGVALNRVSVRSTEVGTDREPDNNANSVTTAIYDVVDMAITKSSLDSFVEANYRFHWNLSVENITADNPAALAESVVVSDTMPAGVFINGSVEATSLSRPPVTCAVAPNLRSFTCELGDMVKGQSYAISIPALYNPSGSGVLASSLTNTATVTTKSFDRNLVNNSASDTRPLPGGVIGGRIYLDFAQNDAFDSGADLAVANVEVTLVGKGGHGQDITLITQTNAQGYYTFTGLAETALSGGAPLDYDVFYTRTTLPAGVTDLHALPNPSFGGQTVNTLRIDAISPSDGPAINNDFTVFKVPTVDLEKSARQLGSAGGIHEFEFQIIAKNTSGEPLNTVSLHDIFEMPAVLTPVAGTATLAPGQYQIIDIKKTGGGQGWSGDTSFDGTAAHDRLGTLNLLPVNARAIITINVKAFPPIPYPSSGITLKDDARVSAQGAYSGVAVADTATASVTLAPQAGISLVKDSGYTLPSAPTVAKPGDSVVYNFTVTNTGTVPLIDLRLSDSYVTATTLTAAGPFMPGQSVTLNLTYSLTQTDIDKGRIDNTATVTGQWRATGLGVIDEDKHTIAGLNQPALTIVKSSPSNTLSIPSSPGDAAAGTNMIQYEFLVTNTGNIALNNLVLSDPLPGLGFDPTTPTAIGTLAPGASKVVKASYPITAADILAGEVRNSASVTGSHGTSVVAPITATSNEHVEPLTPSPQLNVVKAFDSASLPAVPRPGDVIRWTITLTNTGSTDLALGTITESLAGATLGAPGKTTLLRGESTTLTVRYPLTQADINNAQVVNQVTVASEVPGQPGVLVPDTPSDGDPSTPTKEPTITPLPQIASIELIKFIDASKLHSPTQVGDVVDYRFEVRNTGNVDLRDVVIRDTLVGLSPNSFTVGTLLVGAPPTPIGTASYALTQADLDRGFVENRATVDGVYGPSGAPKTVTDASLTDTLLDQPSRLELENPKIALVKSVDTAQLSRPAVPGDLLHYSFAITNTGNLPLNNVTISDHLAGVVMQGGPLPLLAAGQTDTTTFTATYALTQADIDAGVVTNTAHAAAEWGTGSAIVVHSNPSPAEAQLGHPEIIFEIAVLEVVDTDGNAIIAEGDTVLYSFKVTNSGTLPLTDVDLDYSSLSLAMPGLRCTPVSLAVGQSAYLQCRGNDYIITAEDAARGEVVLSGLARGAAAGGMIVDDTSQAPAVTGLGQGGLRLSKIADVDTAYIGDIITYDIEIYNDPKGVAVTTQILDVLPLGFVPHGETALLDGARVTPAFSGRHIRLAPVSLAPGQSRVLRLEVLVTGAVQPGAHINRARLLNSRTGRDIVPEAQAIVRILAEPVFHCATVLGRVFDDRDQNGHMSASGREPGLPNVRLIAPDGRAITTDAHGRFNVPCAALPQSVGSNFMLKLDERSLPSGYRVTTENPRVTRLTQGMITRLDFGATLSRLVRIDLAQQAFHEGALRPEFAAGLAQLVRETQATPTLLQMTYLASRHEDRAQARQHLRQTERYLRQLWRAIGRYTLDIETTIDITSTSGARQ